jgi:hypothetical protein
MSDQSRNDYELQAWALRFLKQILQTSVIFSSYFIHRITVFTWIAMFI